MELGLDARAETENRENVMPKRLALLGLLIVFAFIGASFEFTSEGAEAANVVNQVSGFLVLILVLTWCHFDALERGYALGLGMRAALVFLLLFAFPVYLFRSRGLGGFKAMGLTILFLCAMTLAAALGGLFAYGYAIVFGGA